MTLVRTRSRRRRNCELNSFAKTWKEHESATLLHWVNLCGSCTETRAASDSASYAWLVWLFFSAFSLTSLQTAVRTEWNSGPLQIFAVHKGCSMFNPDAVGLHLDPQFDKNQLRTLLAAFQGAVNRNQDKSLAIRLEKELLLREPPSIERDTFRRLAKWCNTDGNPYRSGMDVARKISSLLFGQTLDRRRLGV
jgi:hypothetical protein